MLVIDGNLLLKSVNQFIKTHIIVQMNFEDCIHHTNFSDASLYALSLD
jgi:hypothetical protein